MNVSPVTSTIERSGLIDELFKDIKPSLSERQARLESSRCFYCHDAPCIKACPTEIDIPSFITSIHSDDLIGAANSIYESNILGGSCSRVCPTEILCEASCVRAKEPECAPVLIGQLQRYATDNAEFDKHPFERMESTGYRIAVVGGGPSGLSCAHRLAVLGNDVDIYEAEDKLGGLNEYGIARYKLTDNFSSKEVKFILDVGGITPYTGKKLGEDMSIESLGNDYDAVFLGIGLQGTNDLGLNNEQHPQVIDAVDYIYKLRQSHELNELVVPNRAVVIGAGNTAIDIACQLKRLGSEDVTLVYRRGEQNMSATNHEIQIAKDHQVQIKTWSKPEQLIINNDNQLTGIVFKKTSIVDGVLEDTGTSFEINCDAVFKAIGQKLKMPNDDRFNAAIDQKKLIVNADFETSIPMIFAGGDCTGSGEDLTVEAVQQGKKAAIAIHQRLTQILEK